MVLYGYVRATGDIDIWINNSKGNSHKVIAALEEFGFSFPNLDAADFQKEDFFLQLGYPPYRIDILTSPSGVSFNECYPNKEIIYLDSAFFIHVIDLVNLKKNKLASGRNKDLDDIENLP